MVIPTSGPISFSGLQNEFGGTNPISMREYYRLGPNVPATGTVSMSNFRGAYDTFFASLTGNVSNFDLYSFLVNLGWNTFSKVQVTIPAGIYVWSNSTSIAALSINNFPREVTIVNSGFIMGQGGNGGNASRDGNYNGLPGGPAILMDSAVNLIIQNQPGGYIGGGGGGGASSPWSGGGGGAGGGVGGSGSDYGDDRNVRLGGAGGSIGAAGATAAGGLPGVGGSAGGGGGGYREEKGADVVGGGGGGGRVFPGTGGAGSEAGGSGGSGGIPGANGGGPTTFARGGGGGGWGAAGGNNAAYSGGPGGKAVNILRGTVSITQGVERIYGVVS